MSTTTKVDLAGVKSEAVTDAHFVKSKVKKSKNSEGEFFKKSENTESNAKAEEEKKAKF